MSWGSPAWSFALNRAIVGCARGVRLGVNGADRLAPANRAAAIERARQLAPILTELQSAGMSARQMAAELAARGVATPSGGRWHAQSVLRMIDRAGAD